MKNLLRFLILLLYLFACASTACAVLNNILPLLKVAAACYGVIVIAFAADMVKEFIDERMARRIFISAKSESVIEFSRKS